MFNQSLRSRRGKSYPPKREFLRLPLARSRTLGSLPKFYWLASFVLVGIAALLFARGSGVTQGAPFADKPLRVQIHDVLGDVTKITRSLSDKTDVSHPYFASSGGTIHLHVLGYTQRTPLHIHRRSDEATVILTGAPNIRQVYGQNGRLVTKNGRVEPTRLVLSPRLCAHEWVNPSDREMQANLVFASPPFDGNLYVSDDDPRILEAGEPAVVDLEVGKGGSAPAPALGRLDLLNSPGGAVSLLDVDGRAVQLPALSEPSALYVLRGSGQISADRQYDFRPGQLIVVADSTALGIQPGMTAARLLVFQPRADY